LVNGLLVGAILLVIPPLIFKYKYGRFSLNNDQIKQIAGGLDIREGHAGVGFNGAVKDIQGNRVYCNQPHPVIGWIDICGGDGFWGFTHVTAKKKKANSYKLLVIGGSVANYLGKSSALETALKERLKELGDSRRVEVFNAAMPGFKQPQQLAVLNALISSGWEFDTVVDISGNNEIAFVANHLFHEGYNPLLPYAHPERALMAAKMLYKPQDECDSKQLLEWHPLRQYIKIRCYRQALEGMKAFVHFQPYLSAMRYKDDLPDTQDEAIKRALQIWLVSTRSSYAVASVNGIRYLQVIQPSQYLTGSKVFSKQEEEQIRNDQSMKVVGTGYSQVSVDDFGLKRDNILDARFIFANTTRPVYIDNCCHLNELGERMLSRAIAKKLLQKQKK
jgi:hypothetical protein